MRPDKMIKNCDAPSERKGFDVQINSSFAWNVKFVKVWNDIYDSLTCTYFDHAMN